jgi:hypothetical protein
MKQATHFTVHLKRPQLPPNLDPYEKYFGMPVRSGKNSNRVPDQLFHRVRSGTCLDFKTGTHFCGPIKVGQAVFPANIGTNNQTLGLCVEPIKKLKSRKLYYSVIRFDF